LYCKFGFQHGADWTLLSGFEQGISQLSSPIQSSNFTFKDVNPCVWNFPIDVAFKSTNVYGWPSLLVTVYGYDFLGRDVVRGYGSIKVPTVPGQ
jgi:B9 domain-containing protein 1